MQTLTIRRPDDWHVHLRDGEMLKLVAPFTSRQFERAIVMPNLVPPITSLAAAADYRQRIRDSAGSDFHPLMTYYLTDEADPELVEHVRDAQLLGRRERHPLPLHAVAQGAVVDRDPGHVARAGAATMSSHPA
jgi:dihydroorotase